MGVVLVGLLGFFVGGFVTLGLGGRAWALTDPGGSLPGAALFAILATVTPAVAAFGWCSTSERPAFERFAIASALTLAFALALGLLLLVVTIPPI